MWVVENENFGVRQSFRVSLVTMKNAFETFFFPVRYIIYP